MKKISFTIALTGLSLCLMAACSPKTKSDWLMNPATKYTRVTEDPASVTNGSLTPEIEILFVVDNSKSMDVHIANVSNNIDQFVDSLGNNLPFPFHVAVTTVYDSRPQYQTQVRDPGELVRIKKSPTEVMENKIFLSSDDPNLKPYLKNTLKVGTLEPKEGGPIIEEMFTPVSAIYELEGETRANDVAREEGFFMKNNSYKVIFFITDASDSSTISADDLYRGLVAKSQGDPQKVISFAAMVNSSRGNCKADPGVKNEKLQDFLQLTATRTDYQNILDLCAGNFGKKLAEFGSEIRRMTISQAIPLRMGIPDMTIDPNAPDYASGLGVWVTYGSSNEVANRQRLLMEIEPGMVGYRYDAKTNSILINPDFKFDLQPGAFLRIEYIPINPANVRRGQVRPWEKPTGNFEGKRT